MNIIKMKNREAKIDYNKNLRRNLCHESHDTLTFILQRCCIHMSINNLIIEVHILII